MIKEKEYEEKYPDVHPQFLFVTDGYNFRNTEINAVLGMSQMKNLDDTDENLILNIDFNQTTTDELIDKTDLSKINYIQDFEVSLDNNLRIKTDTLVIPDGIEQDNSEQAF